MIARLASLTALALLLSPVCAGAATEICGDLDGNGKVVASDAQRLLGLAVGQPVTVECPAVEGGVARVQFDDGQIGAVPACEEDVVPVASVLGQSPPLAIEAGQKAVVQASVGLGTSTGANINLQMCAKDSEGTWSYFGNGIYGVVALAGSRPVYPLNGVFDPGTSGTWNLGICGCSNNGTGPDWDENDYFALTVMVVN